MDILQYLPAAQAADLRAMSKAVEELKKLDLKTVPLDLSSFTYDRALLTLLKQTCPNQFIPVWDMLIPFIFLREGVK
jgi:hypothetical protein